MSSHQAAGPRSDRPAGLPAGGLRWRLVRMRPDLGRRRFGTVRSGRPRTVSRRRAYRTCIVAGHRPTVGGRVPKGCTAMSGWKRLDEGAPEVHVVLGARGVHRYERMETSPGPRSTRGFRRTQGVFRYERMETPPRGESEELCCGTQGVYRYERIETRTSSVPMGTVVATTGRTAMISSCSGGRGRTVLGVSRSSTRSSSSTARTS